MDDGKAFTIETPDEFASWSRVTWFRYLDVIPLSFWSVGKVFFYWLGHQQYEKPVWVSEEKKQASSLGIKSPCQMMIGVYKHLSKVFRFHETILRFGEPGFVGLLVFVQTWRWVPILCLQKVLVGNSTPAYKSTQPEVAVLRHKIQHPSEITGDLGQKPLSKPNVRQLEFWVKYGCFQK